MVGAAQYLDDEIDWVLSAVVGKKKQSYIQTHFHEKFGRHLNHNQIRYIKNKYGKDPRFKYVSSPFSLFPPLLFPYYILLVFHSSFRADGECSPLVNARPPRMAVSPKLGGGRREQDDEGEPDDEDEVNLRDPGRAGPSSALKVGERRRESRDEAATSTLTTRMKRKRSVDESSDLGERLVKRITGSQRADSQPEAAAASESAPRAAHPREPLQQWRSTSTTRLQPSSLGVSSASPLGLSLADNYFDTLQTGEHGNLPTQQQPNTLQFLHTSDMWTAPVPSQSSSTWPAGHLAAFPGGGSNNNNSAPDAYMSVYPALPATTTEELYRPVEQTAGMMSQMPVNTQYQLQMPSNQPTPFSVSQFSPALPDLAPSPFQHYLEQQQIQPPNHISQSGQHQQYHLDVSAAQPFSQLSISEPQATPNLGNNTNNNNNNSLSVIPYHPMPPTFQGLPTDTPSSQHNWSLQMTPPSPYDFSSTFTPIISPQSSADFSFQNAHFGVSTAATAAAGNSAGRNFTPSLASRPEMQPHHHAHPPTSFEQQQQQQQLYIDAQLNPEDLAGTIDPNILFGPHGGEYSAVAAALQPNVSSSSKHADIARD
ncbi:hypothetical protein TgHK011_007517 [Trichoderma gracile]|nr:hypothetical protein TgHK011_007517 [Trichoderma gracile]